RFIKVIINFFMTKDPSIPRRNKFGAILHVELTNEDIRNSAAYKKYYAIASGAAPPKTKASVRNTLSSFDTTMPPPTAACTRLSTLAKWKQPAKSSNAKGLSVLSEVALTKAEQMKLATKRSLQQTHISQASGSGTDEGTEVDDDLYEPGVVHLIALLGIFLRNLIYKIFPQKECKNFLFKRKFIRCLIRNSWTDMQHLPEVFKIDNTFLVVHLEMN
nr:hypothetical protein [Tanacetum cinerariifolium]